MRRIFLSGALFALLPLFSASALTITRYPATYAESPIGISGSSDGDVWVSSHTACSVVRYDTAGDWTFARTWGPPNCPTFLTAGPDDFIWSTHPNANTVFRSKQGAYEGYTPMSGAADPYGIAFGPDGAAWFTEYDLGKVGFISDWGVVSKGELSLSGATSHPAGIAVSGGRIWAAESSTSKIANIDPSTGTRFYVDLPAGSYPWMICSGPDHAVYFTEQSRNRIGRITHDTLAFTEFLVPTPGSGPDSITLGPDGNLWFTEFSANKIGRMTPDGVFTEWPLPTGAHPKGITTDTKGHIWFVENGTSMIGKITLHVPGDADGNGLTNVVDVFYLINFLFADGPEPVE